MEEPRHVCEMMCRRKLLPNCLFGQVGRCSRGISKSRGRGRGVKRNQASFLMVGESIESSRLIGHSWMMRRKNCWERGAVGHQEVPGVGHQEGPGQGHREGPGQGREEGKEPQQGQWERGQVERWLGAVGEERVGFAKHLKSASSDTETFEAINHPGSRGVKRARGGGRSIMQRQQTSHGDGDEPARRSDGESKVCKKWRNFENSLNNPGASPAQVKQDTDDDDKTGDNEEDLSNISLEFR